MTWHIYIRWLVSRLNNINNITGVFKRISADLTDFTEREVIRYVLTLRNQLISDPPIGTPIDTGWASNNWWYSDDGPATGVASDVNAAKQRQDQDTQSIATFKLNGQTVHITNNVPYIGRLNNGWSQQTPAGFVDRAILTAGIKVRFNS